MAKTTVWVGFGVRGSDTSRFDGKAWITYTTATGVLAEYCHPLEN